MLLYSTAIGYFIEMSHHISLWIWNLYVYLSIDSLMVVRVGWKKCWRHWRQMTILNTFVELGHYNECMHLHIDRLTTNISIISIMHMLEGIAHIMLCACTRKHFRRIYFRHTFLNCISHEKNVFECFSFNEVVAQWIYQIYMPTMFGCNFQSI